MTARSSSFLCPKLPNAPTSAAAFAQRPIGIYPISYRPSGSAPLQRHRPSGRIAPVSSVTELREPPRAQKCRFCAQNARKQGFQTPKTHKNADFVLERGKNQGKIASSDTKMPILCSKCLKTWVPEAKKAQKPRFCARKARKRGSRRSKAHKNADFVLGKRGNWHREAQPLPSCKSSRTRMCPRGA